MSELGDVGARRIEWARDHMPVLAAIRDELKQKKAVRGIRIGMALHVEAKTGVLALFLREAGATIRLASCNPLSTDDSVATALAETNGLEFFFFQAEDGIRDLTVTGVQTCALPI